MIILFHLIEYHIKSDLGSPVTDHLKPDYLIRFLQTTLSSDINGSVIRICHDVLQHGQVNSKQELCSKQIIPHASVKNETIVWCAWVSTNHLITSPSSLVSSHRSSPLISSHISMNSSWNSSFMHLINLLKRPPFLVCPNHPLHFTFRKLNRYMKTNSKTLQNTLSIEITFTGLSHNFLSSLHALVTLSLCFYSLYSTQNVDL